MFKLFKKDPIKQLEKKHTRLLEEAMTVQRSGDLRKYAAMMEEAQTIEDEIIELNNKKA